jgi:MFS family permease
MQQTAMSWFVYQITNSKLLLGIVAAMGSAPMMLSSIWGGSLADRYSKRSILLANPDGPNDLCVLSCSWCLAGFRHAVVHYRYRCIERGGHGFRYASASGVHNRNDKP